MCLGDGEAETGPLATAWHSTTFLDPVGDGAVLPILHLNGYEMANPALLARIGDAELTSLLEGFGHTPYLVAGNHPQVVHQQLAATLDHVLDEIARVQTAARTAGSRERPSWPMIVLRTPKGWTGPEVVDGVPVEDTWRSHQVPVAGVHDRPEHLAMLEDWLRSYQPGSAGLPDLRRAGPFPRRDIIEADPGPRRMAARRHERERPEPQLSHRRAGRDGVGLQAVYEVTGKAWQAETLPCRRTPGSGRRVLEILSEHTCQGWLEGYLLTGRHGLFSCYEAFVHIVDSMFSQHARWLKVIRGGIGAARSRPVEATPQAVGCQH